MSEMKMLGDVLEFNVYPLECPVVFETLTCKEIAWLHRDCVDPDCLVCGVHEALADSEHTKGVA